MSLLFTVNNSICWFKESECQNLEIESNPLILQMLVLRDTKKLSFYLLISYIDLVAEPKLEK